jgi:hypothetical protein
VFLLNLPNKPPDGTGGNGEGYAETITCRGKLKMRSQTDAFVNGYDEMVTVYDGWIPWRKDIEVNLSKDVRVTVEARSFKIDGFNLEGEQRKTYHLKLVEVR